MVTESMVYWMTRMDHIRGVLMCFWLILISIGVLTVVVGGIGTLIVHVEERHPFGDPTKRSWRRCTSIGGIVGFIGAVFFLVCAFIPTTREYAAIKVLPAVANNEDLQALGTELPRLAREWLEELRPKKNGKEADGKKEKVHDYRDIQGQ